MGLDQFTCFWEHFKVVSYHFSKGEINIIANESQNYLAKT